MDDLEKIKRKKLEKLMRLAEKPEKNASPMPSSPIEANDSNFDSIISKYPLVLVDFWAQWCGPCRIVAPVIDALAEKFSGRLVCAKLDVDQNRISASKYKAMSIPMLLVFKNGQIVDKIIGAQPQQQIESRLVKHM